MNRLWEQVETVAAESMGIGTATFNKLVLTLVVVAGGPYHSRADRLGFQASAGQLYPGLQFRMERVAGDRDVRE